jgi:glycosyltransferase involved in cell wall biosynthesis
MQPITIIIPTHNRAQALATVWESYTGNPLVRGIIVVNDGSTDNTKQVLEYLIKHTPTPVKIIHHSKRMGVQIAKMTGIAEVDTKWVLFGEDDVWLHHDYINTLFQEAEKVGAKIIAGRLLNVTNINNKFDSSALPKDESPYSDNIFDTKHLVAHFEAHSKYLQPAPYLHAVALVHSSVFAKVKFDTKYIGNALREETDFYLSADAAMFPIFWTPATACYHLRGPISLVGGHRRGKINWFRIEFWGYVNTWIFIKKHWPHLSNKYAFKKNPLYWFITIYCKDRISLYFDRIMNGRISKTWSNK